MAEITDQDRRDMLEWARIAIASKDNHEHAPWVTAARYILDNVDAPAPTLAEELREVGARYKSNIMYDVPKAIAALATRAEQMEQERDEARAEVTALAEDLAGAESEVERITTERTSKESLQVDQPDPADVPAGEAWLVECRGEQRTAVKDSDAAIPWNTVNTSGVFHAEYNEDVALLTRLVPAPRVITNPDELEHLAATSIIRDGRGWPGGITDQGGIMINGFCLSAEDVLSLGPVTVLWEPEA